MNVRCIHRLPYSKPCFKCGRVGASGISDHSRNEAIELLKERQYLKRQLQDIKILLSCYTIAQISELTGISESTLRRLERRGEEQDGIQTHIHKG